MLIFIAGFASGAVLSVLVLGLVCRCKCREGLPHSGALKREKVAAGMNPSGPWMIYTETNRCDDPRCWCNDPDWAEKNGSQVE